MSTEQFTAEDLEIIVDREYFMAPNCTRVDVIYRPTGDRTFSIKRHELEAKAEALEKLYTVVRKERIRSEAIGTPREALLNAMSWSNANLKWSHDYTVDDSDDQEIADDILRGLKHVGWHLVKDTEL